jgi:hypothetical protein
MGLSCFFGGHNYVYEGEGYRHYYYENIKVPARMYRCTKCGETKSIIEY